MKKAITILMIFTLLCVCGCGSSQPKLTAESTNEEIFEQTTHNYDDLSIIETPSGGLKISYHSTGHYADESGLMSNIISDYVDFCNNLYELKDYDSVYCTVFVDTNEGVSNAVNFEIMKSDYDGEAIKDATYPFKEFSKQCIMLDISKFISDYLEPEKIFCM